MHMDSSRVPTLSSNYFVRLSSRPATETDVESFTEPRESNTTLETDYINILHIQRPTHDKCDNLNDAYARFLHFRTLYDISV